ncbi:MAG: hypothetical protein IJN78_04265 [Clostridia bacterium]|nr:hypothetical protein [Clostridia bacterium]
MNYNFDDYLNVVKQNIKNKKLHAPICAELESHLQDSADFYVEIGYDEVTAKYKALEDMGPPHYVAEDLAKLHKLSAGQIFAEVVYIVLMLPVIGMALLSPVISISYSHAFFFMLVPVIAGYIMSVCHKRILPARMAVISAVINFKVLISYWSETVARLTGQWADYRTMQEIAYGTKNQNMIISIIALLLTVAVIGLLIFTYRKISIYIRTPNISSVNFKRVFSIVAIPLLCIVFAGAQATDIYLHQADLEEKEKWCSVVEDFCDYCLEKEKITAADIDGVLAHFDYLEFKEYEHIDDTRCIRHLSAIIGEKSEAFPHFYICIMEDGSIRIEIVSYINTVEYYSDSDWKQESDHYTWDDNPLMDLNIGDDATKFFDVIKDENLLLFYRYDAEDDEVIYSTYFIVGESIFDNFTFYVTVDSGKIIKTAYDDFP